MQICSGCIQPEYHRLAQGRARQTAGRLQVYRRSRLAGTTGIILDAQDRLVTTRICSTSDQDWWMLASYVIRLRSSCMFAVGIQHFGIKDFVPSSLRWRAHYSGIFFRSYDASNPNSSES